MKPLIARKFLKPLLAHLVVWLGLVLAPPALLPSVAQAELKLPSYASGANVQAEVEKKGKNITDVVLIVVGIISMLGLLVGAGYMGAGNTEKGKQIMLGGVGGIVIASLVFGIAKLVAT